MEYGLGRTFHVHMTIVFDWKMMAVIVSAYLIRLLISTGGSACHPPGLFNS